MLVDEFIDHSQNVTDCETLIILFEKAITQLGFDKFVYTFMTEQPNLKKGAEHGVIRSYPEEWMNQYVEKEYMHVDPTYRLALTHAGVFSWEQIERSNNLHKKSIRMMREAEEAHVRSGASVAIHGPNREITGFGFASTHADVDLEKVHLHKLRALAHQFHLTYCDIFSANTNHIKLDEFILTNKEREVLLWCSRGKSNSVIADIMLLSEHTVDFHLRNIFQKLKVNDRTVAVLQAYKLRLIEL